ncbi:amidohydrolase family protein [candidate division KSB1 bacterium]|nr:amidohydrolase family protein [candidate division KSB1 bacterium]
MNLKITLLIVLITLFGYSLSLPAEKADLILLNGKIITVDVDDHIYQALAAKEGKILAVGSDSEIKTLVGPQSKMIDLKGKCVTPGLIDSHYHLMYYGAQFWEGFLNIRHPVATSKSELLQVVGDYAQQLSPGEWISGNQGFMLQLNETISRWDLDTVAPNNPAYLRHASGQYSVVNSMALEIAGIDSSTPSPPGSLIMHDANGQPTGILSHYPAENLVGKYAPGYGDRTDEETFENIERGQQLCLEAGYTSVQDVIVGNVSDIMSYKQFADSGLLKVRLYAMLYLDYEQQADTLAKIFKPIDSGLFKFGGWKLAMDGGLAAGTTLMYDKNLYASQISYPYHSQEELNHIVQILHDTGLQVAIHVGGDEGIDMVITAFENAMQSNPRPDPRHRIEHGLFPTVTALQRMQASNIILSTQPQWITWYGDGYAQTTDDGTMARFLPLKTMLDMGIPLAFGCDVPASPYQEPKWAFKGATLRRTVAGTPLTQTERLTIQEALRIHTMGSAYAGFAEDSTGSLEPGKFADLVIWTHDIYTMSPTEANDLAAEMTIVGGEIVFDDGKNPVTYAANHWFSTGNMLHARLDHTATLLKNGKVLIVGWDSNVAELYDPVSDTFSATGSTIYNHRQGATATLMDDGQVLIVGGVNAPQAAELFDPATGNFQLTGNLNTVHSYHTAALLPDSRVLIAGGQEQNGPQTHAVCEIYDPLSGTFSLTDSLSDDRSCHTATLLPNGQVLIVGGIQTSTPGNAYNLSSCELYHPVNGSFSPAQSLVLPRSSHAATLLNDGRVLISCGVWNQRYGELYDPSMGTWSQTGEMTIMRRNYHTATLLCNGNVLLAGGFINASTSTAEIYDPSTNTFSAVDSMITARMEHTATRLPDGSVLVTGGYSASGAINLAERFVIDTTVVRVNDNLNHYPNAPEHFQLLQNYPNPFNPTTTIQFRLPVAAQVELSICNIIGEKVRTLLRQRRDAGLHSITWDGLDDAGKSISCGVYLCVMQSNNYMDSKKIILLK